MSTTRSKTGQSNPRGATAPLSTSYPPLPQNQRCTKTNHNGRVCNGRLDKSSRRADKGVWRCISCDAPYLAPSRAQLQAQRRPGAWETGHIDKASLATQLCLEPEQVDAIVEWIQRTLRGTLSSNTDNNFLSQERRLLRRAIKTQSALLDLWDQDPQQRTPVYYSAFVEKHRRWLESRLRRLPNPTRKKAIPLSTGLSPENHVLWSLAHELRFRKGRHKTLSQLTAIAALFKLAETTVSQTVLKARYAVLVKKDKSLKHKSVVLDGTLLTIINPHLSRRDLISKLLEPIHSKAQSRLAELLPDQ